MPDKNFKVTLEPDHLRKLSGAKPIPAVAELIWNGVDADATRVDLELDLENVLDPSITVRDNGHGIPHEDVEGLFGKLGGSWKGHGNRSKIKNRILHGKEGKGRFKALALGRVANWISVYRKDGKTLRFTISIIRDALVDVRVSEPDVVPNTLPTGIEIRITELDHIFRTLQPDQSVPSLSAIFALYLTTYKDVSIYVEHQKLDPDAIIGARETFPLPDIEDDGETYQANVELIEWLAGDERWMFLCGPEGFPFFRSTPNFHTPGRNFSAYLKSDYVNVLQRQGLIDLADMNAPLQSACQAAAERIKLFFKEKDAEDARNEIEKWQADDVYPYREEPRTSVERAERQVFDILALNLNRQIPDFAELDKRNRAFQLRMLKHAVERGPNELQLIFREVLGLPERKQKELSKLLQEADLANIISASRLVADRLKLLTGLEALIFDPDTKKTLKERSQLHRIIADNNTWIFGEEFSLTVDDQSLTEVLKKHRKLLDDDIAIDAPVKRIDGKVGIVDLMLSRSVPQSHKDEREHLVVELKRPSVKIGDKEITQIKKYAYTVADDERFRGLNTQWSFWVVSNDLDRFARQEARQKDKPRGQIFQSEDGSITVWVKTWSEILAECRARLKFVEDKLQANVDRERALKYLRTTYDRYLRNLPDPLDEQSEEDVGSDEDEPSEIAE
ncbi:MULTISPECIES: ATP-binding protein [unclassified Aureimonas]|uniref:ATP-binding protein n=1 Tax=unclassified Aureimonas TaxID=2615206 RepID=UPI000700F6DF|nr:MULTISPECIES: ATP-binding protein [unclassified Aureimonas]KQT59823.1 hypothetical protein ASG62_24375 [Aureimonas sp. Leaf427]KQT62288.1 hypothetical protein ASG54_05490 [Aureimonas sp. Leaf460]